MVGVALTPMASPSAIEDFTSAVRLGFHARLQLGGIGPILLADVQREAVQLDEGLLLIFAADR